MGQFALGARPCLGLFNNVAVCFNFDGVKLFSDGPAIIIENEPFLL